MGIQVEFNPDLALRAYKEYAEGRRDMHECVPEELLLGVPHAFWKRGQRLYWLEGEIPLCITEGEGRLSAPIASIKLLEVTHSLHPSDGSLRTDGYYQIVEVFTDGRPRFNGWARIS